MLVVRTTPRGDAGTTPSKECVALDYSETSLIAHWIRDEIRLVAPALYLGIVYWGHDRLINFALDFPR